MASMKKIVGIVAAVVICLAVIIGCLVYFLSGDGDSDFEQQNNSKIVGDNLHIRGNNNHIQGNNSKVRGNNNQITGNDAVVNGNNNRIFGDNAVVDGNNEEIEGFGAKVIGNNAGVKGDSGNVKGNNAVVSGNKAIIDGNNGQANGGGAKITGNNPRITGDGGSVCSDIGRQLEVAGSNVHIEVRANGNNVLRNVVFMTGRNEVATSDCSGFDGLDIKTYDVRIWGKDLVVKVSGNVIPDNSANVNGNVLAITRE